MYWKKKKGWNVQQWLTIPDVIIVNLMGGPGGIWKSALRYSYELLKEYEESGGEHGLDFANHLTLKCVFHILQEVRATSHTRLKGPDHGNVRALIGWKGGDRPSSLHTRRWRPKGPKKNLWMKSLHGVLHGRLWIRVHGLPKFVWGPPPRGGPDANYKRPNDFF